LDDIPRELVLGKDQRAGQMPTKSAELEQTARTLNFRAGDRVKHPTFGEGVDVNSRAVGADEEVEIAFIGKGVKKLIAGYAGLKKK
jgi:DNA helicase-2/ATP-dependent DNA helicase PcrA